MMSKTLSILFLIGSISFLYESDFFVFSSQASVAECKKVRFADVGWTDISATTALASVILESLGYESKTTQLSVPITYASLKNRDIDVFLGNWMPTMAADIRPYQADGSVETVGTILKKARYTLVVPKYVHDAGVKSVADLSKYKDQFQGKIYGIEPGNDGNRLIQKMISDGSLGLSNWKLIESSEQAMLMEALQSYKRKKWIVFLGWEPHPMNQKMQISYLQGADQYFGAKQGSSSVFINTRKGYQKECPEVAAFLKKFTLNVETETALMSMILDQGLEPKRAAHQWIRTHLRQVEPWLAGVKARDGRNGFSVLSEKVASK